MNTAVAKVSNDKARACTAQRRINVTGTDYRWCLFRNTNGRAKGVDYTFQCYCTVADALAAGNFIRFL